MRILDLEDGDLPRRHVQEWAEAAAYTTALTTAGRTTHDDTSLFDTQGVGDALAAVGSALPGLVKTLAKMETPAGLLAVLSDPDSLDQPRARAPPPKPRILLASHVPPKLVKRFLARRRPLPRPSPRRRAVAIVAHAAAHVLPARFVPGTTTANPWRF
jgi:hypothetical protein